ncbi:MAG: MFS transporter [Candidatus Omnitrophota bacterium]|nr:MAG: MFS transporter [Candidatus Omnitrophota bacterium]
MPKKSLFIFGLTFFTVSFGVAAMAALIPSIAAHFGAEQVYAARLIWLYMLPYGVFALFWSPLTRLMQVKKIIIFTTLGFCFSSLLFSLSKTIHQAFVFRFLMGCFGCSFVPLMLITVGKTVPTANKGKYIGTLFSLSYVSTCLSVFLSGFISWRIIYLMPAVLSFLIFILILRHLEDFDFRSETFRISYLETFKDKQAVTFFVAIIAGSFLYHSVQQWLGVYLNKTYVLSQLVISLIFTTATVSSAIFEFAGGFFSSHFGGIKVTRVGFIMMSIFASSLFFLRQYQLFFLFIVLWGSGWALTHVGLSSYLTHFPDRALRDASSLNSALRFVAGGIGAFFGGFLISRIGFKSHFLITGVSIFVLGCCLRRLLQGAESMSSFSLDKAATAEVVD